MALRELLLRRHRAFFVLGCLASLLGAWIVLFRADLSPAVEGDFFFATDDPQLRSSRRIGEVFPSGDQVLISVSSPERLSDDTLDRIRRLSDELAALDGVASVQSLTRGPSAPKAVPESPLWSRLLLGSNPSSSTVLLFLEDLSLEDLAASPGADDAASRRIRAVEEVVARHHAPSFALAISGVPYVVEQIRRALSRDLRVFSLSSLLVFLLVIALVYRSLPVVLGTLATCLGACAVTLAILHLVDKPIGLLTANLVTIVFVLTLSHLVFLTANERRESAGGDLGPQDAARRAVRLTFPASCFCALTTGLGFGSLLFASAKPLRELGFAGAVGTLVALALAYAVYPTVLHLAARTTPRTEDSDEPGESEREVTGRLPVWLRRRQGLLASVLLGLAAVAAVGLPRLDTDPGLFSYFDPESELRRGLERIDRDGGSSPLLFVVSMPKAKDLVTRLDTPEAQKRMAKLHVALEQDPVVGTALSLPILLEEARQVPFAVFLSFERLVDVLESERFDRVARSFVDEERRRGLYFMRIFESEASVPRREVIQRLAAEVDAAGLELELVGGLYELQAALGELVAASLVRGLGGLLLLFVGVAWIVSRHLATTAAMIVSLAAVPVLVLGSFGLLGLPLDVISSPAANVAIALGIDAMIHLVSAVRRERVAGKAADAAWDAARTRLWPAVVGATTILAAGFSLFGLSSFPPTARFGLAIAAGTLAAAAMALVALPWLGKKLEGS